MFIYAKTMENVICDDVVDGIIGGGSLMRWLAMGRQPK